MVLALPLLVGHLLVSVPSPDKTGRKEWLVRAHLLMWAGEREGGATFGGSRDLLGGVAVDQNEPPNLRRRDIFLEEKGEIAGGIKCRLLLGLIT